MITPEFLSHKAFADKLREVYKTELDVHTLRHYLFSSLNRIEDMDGIICSLKWEQQEVIKLLNQAREVLGEVDPGFCSEERE